MTRNTLTAGALFAALALAATPTLAQDLSYPRVIGTGENAVVDYGPDGPAQRNIIGGGPVRVGNEPNGTVTLSYPDDRQAQPGRRGVRAETRGTGENSDTVWVPLREGRGISLTQG